MHDYIGGFDAKVGTKASEVTATLDQRLARFQEALDSRTQTLNDALSSRVMDIAKTLAEGGKEVVTALDRRIEDVTGVINPRGAKLAEELAELIAICHRWRVQRRRPEYGQTRGQGRQRFGEHRQRRAPVRGVAKATDARVVMP